MKSEEQNFEILKQNVKPLSIYLEFAEKFIKYKKEYKTNKFIFFMQIGSFFECYAWNIKSKLILFNEEFDCAANILNMIKSYKNNKTKGHDIDNPRMFGFPIGNKERHINKLLDEDYTIVLAIQRHCKKNNKKYRDVIKRYTSGTNQNNNNDNNYIMNIYLNKMSNQKIYCGLSLININANDNYVFECSNSIYDPNCVINNLVRIILMYDPIEYLIYNMTDITDEYLLNVLNIANKKYVIKKHILYEYKKIDYQIEFYNNIYGKESLVNSIQKINLGNLPDARLSLLLLIKYINIQNKILLKNLAYPIYINFKNFLKLDYNTVEQLNIISDNKFKDYNILTLLNYTSTNMGKRLLKRRLMTPFALKEDIELSYNLIEEMITNYKKYEMYLNEISDITRKHKKIYFETISPMELYDLNQNYKYIIKILILIKDNNLLNKYIKEKYNLKITDVQNYINEYQKIFNVDNNKYCRYINDTEKNIFNFNYNKELDDITDKINIINQYKYNIKYEINNFFKNQKGNVYYDKTDLLYVTQTKLKYMNKTNKIGSYFYKHKKIKNKNYLYTDELEENNIKMTKLLEDFRLKMCDVFLSYIEKLNDKKTFFEKLEEVIALVDFIKSGCKCAMINNYVKPLLNSDIENSKFEIINLRHPIIEKINKNVPFISNSLSLNDKTNGLLLSGINGCGKSILLKNIGIIIIIAQAGLYAPCEYIKYTPFNYILTRIKGNDNIFTNSSSYTVEMQELNNILKKTNDKSLVLIDELCKGTEQASSHSLTISIIKELIENKKSIFILTSHMHSIFNHKIINNFKINKKLLIKHMSIKIKNNEIIYERKLLDGPSNNTYGLEIAKHLGIDNEIINNAIEIRNEFLNKSNEILPIKKSIYNNDKFMKCCEICNSEEQLETHHIIEQEKADENGFIKNENFHKNDIHNLCVLCNKCHKKITYGKMKITQRYNTSNGIKFDVENIKVNDTAYLRPIILKLKEEKKSFKKIKNHLKNQYNIDLSIYKINKMYKALIK